MNRELLAFAAATFASGFALRVVDPLVLPLAAGLKVGHDAAALLTAAYALPYAFAQPLLGPLGDRFGKLRCMQVCGAGMALALVLGALANSYAFLLATRVVGGALAGGLIPLVLASLGERYPMQERQVVIGRMLLAIIGGQMAGSAAAGVIAEALGWRAALGATAVLGVLGAAAIGVLKVQPAVAVAAGGPARPASPSFSWMAPYRLVFGNPRAPWVYASVLAEGLLFFALFPYVGALLLERAAAPGEAGVSQAGLVLGAFGVGGLVYALAVRRLLALLSVRQMCLFGSLAAAAAYAGLAWASAWWLCAVFMLVAGLSFYMLHNSLQTEATELAPAARASAVSLFAFGLFAGQGLGTLLLAPLLRYAGFTPVLLGMAAGVLLLGQAVVRRALRPAASQRAAALGTPAKP